jgi:hypothetical protein
VASRLSARVQNGPIVPQETDIVVTHPIVSGRVVGKPEVIPPIFPKIPAAAVGRTGRSVPVLFQFADPDVAVADWVIMVLQGEREFFWAGGVRRADVVAVGPVSSTQRSFSVILFG